MSDTFERFEFESKTRFALVEIAMPNFRRSDDEVFCPFCGASSGYVKTNGDGFYRCKGECKSTFFLMRGDAR